MIANFTVYKNLLQFFGFGPTTARIFLSSIGISTSTVYQDLQPFKLDLLLHTLASIRKSSTLHAYNSSAVPLFIEKSLQKIILDNITRYKNNLSYHGGRLSFGYPVRGGRTRSNANNAKKLKFSF